METPDKPSSSPQRPVAVLVAGILAGLWVLVAASAMAYNYHGEGGWYGPRAGGIYGRGPGWWMWHHRMMHNYGPPALWPWLGAAAGVVIVLGSVLAYSWPASARGWGVLVLLASFLAILSGAGGFAAGVLGAAAGILAILWPSPKQDIAS